MKISIVITGLATGGAEWALYNLLKGGLAEKFDCHVISLNDEGTMGPKITALGIPVSSLDILRGCPLLSGLRKFRKIVEEFQPDIIQGWMYHGNLAATLGRGMAAKGTALAWNIRHSLYDLNLEKSMTKQVIRLNKILSCGPDVLLYNSRLSQIQHEKFGFASENSRVLPNGIDIRTFTISALSRQKVRTELGVSKDALVVGHVARLHPMKDHPLFLKVAVELAQRDPTIHFLLSGRDVTLEDRNIEQLLPLELRNRFHLLGERDDIPELMNAMDIFCLSSWSEAFPNVIGEAMATGLPCIVTDVGDSKMIVGETGMIVPARAEKKLFDGINRFLNLSMQERQALGKRARIRIEEKYTLSAIVKQYEALYEQLILTKRMH